MLGIELALGYKNGSAQSMPPKRPRELDFYTGELQFVCFFCLFLIGPVGVLIFVDFQKELYAA